MNLEEEMAQLQEIIKVEEAKAGKISVETERQKFEYYAAHHKKQYELAKEATKEAWKKSVDKDEELRNSPNFNEYLKEESRKSYEQAQNGLQPSRDKLAVLEAEKSISESKEKYMSQFEYMQEEYKKQSIFKRALNKIQGKIPKWDEVRHAINTYDASKEGELHEQMQQLYGPGKYNVNVVPVSEPEKTFEENSGRIRR